MARPIAFTVTTITLAIPLVGTTTGAATSPADYRPECENAYQSGKAVWDTVLGPGKALFGPTERSICGEQKHTPGTALLS